MAHANEARPVPVVSVVIPTFNRARDLQRALQSVARQTFGDWEVLVVDQHSTDDTDAVVASLNEPRIRLLKMEGVGAAPSRNRGIREARGGFIAFLDSDDWWAPRKLEASVAVLHRGADVVYHDLFLVTRPGQRFFWRKARSRQLTQPAVRDLLANENAIPLSSAVVRRDVLLAAGGMPEDPSLIATEDYECWLSVARRTERFVRIPGTFGYYWAGGGNTSTDTRTLRIMEQFEALHGHELEANGQRIHPWWVPYSRGKILFRAGERDAARREFRQTLQGQVPLSVRLKTFGMLALLALPLGARRA